MKTRPTSPTLSKWRTLVASTCAATVLAFATQASALTSVGAGAFSGSATTLTFEGLPNDVALPPGYGGVSFTAGTISEFYASYGSPLDTNAASAGLGSVAGTFGGNGSYGTGFSLPAAQARVGMYLSSNVSINVPVSAYRNGVLLGTLPFSSADDQIGFVGLEDAGGIDQIVIGNNTDCSSCIHQMDNVMFEGAAARAAASKPVPSLSQWGVTLLSVLLALGAVVALRRRA
jgi:hypothetical protein